MPSWIESLPIGWAIVALFVIVFFRAQATYWLGRGITAGVVRSRRMDSAGPRMDRARASIDRWGWPVIPFSFLLVGFHTAVLLTVGLVQMRWWKFTAAMLPGCLVWAILYAYGLLALVVGALALAATSPWALVAVLVGIGGLVSWLLLRRRRRKRKNEAAHATYCGKSESSKTDSVTQK